MRPGSSRGASARSSRRTRRSPRTSSASRRATPPRRGPGRRPANCRRRPTSWPRSSSASASSGPTDRRGDVRRRPSAPCVLGLVLALATPAAAGIRVTFSPPTLRPGDVGLVIVQGVDDGATIEGSVAGHPLEFFPYARLTAALAAVDFETRPGRYPWKIAVQDGPGEPHALSGRLVVSPRRFPVERLTLPPAMVDLDVETTRRADAEQAQLRTVFGMVTRERLWRVTMPRTVRSCACSASARRVVMVTRERLWRGRFTPPVAAAGAGHGFGARRVINGRPRSAHAGLDR